MKRILIYLLVIAMALPIVACRNNVTDGSQTSQSSQTEQSETQSGTETDDLSFDLPDTNLDGFTMTMFRSSRYFTEKGVFSDSEMSGDQVSDAVFKRNAMIEKKYNCKIELLSTVGDHPAHEIQEYVASNDGAVDMLLDGAGQIVGRTQYFLDLNQLDYFDFEKPWWNRDFNEGVSLNNKLYLTIGSYMLDARQYVFHIIFDKTVAEDIQIDPNSLYDLVDNNEWTLEKMTSFAKRATKDLNGNSVVDADDRFGFLGQVYLNWSLALGAGLHCVEKDVDDMPEVTINSERNNLILDAIVKLTGDSTTTLFAERMQGVDNVWGKLRQLETSTGQWLFLGGALGDYMRTVDGDYGVLPMPKFDSMQERYYHDASLGNSPTTAIPVCATDGDKVAFILEAMSYYSYTDVLPVFYDNYLNTKLVRDEKSVEMLQLIHESLYYDVGALYGWGGMHGIVATMVDQNRLAIEYDAIKEKIQTEMNATLEKQANQ